LEEAMNVARLSGLAACAWAALACAIPSEAGPIGPGAFGPGALLEGFTGLGLPLDNAAPLVVGGNSYSTDNGRFRYYDFSFAGCTGECIGTDTELGFIDAVFGSAVYRAGGYVSVGFYSWSATVSFYDMTNALLGSLLLSGGASAPAFAGWEHPGLIARMRVTDTASNTAIILLDNVTTESPSTSPVPEPTALTFLGLGLAGLAVRRGSRMRRG
jgi:hypothetical protein